MKALPAVVSHVFARAPGYRRRDPEVVPEEVTDRAALATLKLVRKSELPELQRADPPFGGLSVIAPPQAAKLFSSPGPVFELEPRSVDPWRASRALRAAGFRAGDVVHNSFSYHLTPAGSMIETGAHALGCAVIPAGTAPTEAQATAAAQFRATAYGGTPSFLKVLLDRAAELEAGPVVADARVGDRGGVAGGAAEGARRARGPGAPVVRDGRRGPHRLRDAGDGRAGGGRGRDPGDRPSGHGGPGSAGRGGGGGGDDPLRGSSAAALRDRETSRRCFPVRARAVGPTCGSAGGWGGRTSRRRCGACSCTRATWRSWCGDIRWCAGRG